jgi:uncharacterized protein
MVNILIAAALAGASPAPATPVPVDIAEPAMFVVRDADTTVYIFGTFHALDGKSQWLNDRVKHAFEQSDELVLETLVPEGPNPLAGLPAAMGQAFSVLPVTSSASFLATTRMAISAGRAQGMQAANGADMVLRHVAEDEGKPVEGLESLQFQLDMFNHMPPAAPAPQPGIFASDGAPMATLSKSMAEMQSAWKHGDQAVFARMLDQLRRSSPDTYRVMFTERNARWADWISARMRAPGIVFVAVGAGHLAGKDSLLVRLAERGIESTRLN